MSIFVEKMFGGTTMQTQLASDDPRFELPLEEFVTYRLLQLTSRLNRQGTQILADHSDFRLPEWRCLAMIGRYGVINQIGIADLTGMDRSLVTRAVQNLLDKKYVSTTRDANDRRVVLARLTRSGVDLFARVFPLMERRQVRLLAALSAGDRKAFYRIVSRFNEVIDRWEEDRTEHEAS